MSTRTQSEAPHSHQLNTALSMRRSSASSQIVYMAGRLDELVHHRIDWTTLTISDWLRWSAIYPSYHVTMEPVALAV